MSRVRVLPDTVIDQIAAGEVVDRPASVVKELVENALDAQATTIEIFLRNGGADRIRITDDGIGMDREDAMMCLERHATSKIRASEDLAHIQSLGFRGEALPSIASVSKFTLTTRPPELEAGVRVRIHGGTLVDVRGHGCAAGTEFDIAELFYNLPARRKFLRTRATELAHCTEAVVRMALMRPDVAFRLIHEGRTLVAAEPTDLPGRARQVLGRDAQQMVAIDATEKGVSVAGLVSPLAVHRPSGKALYLYVNGRYVRDAVVRRAVQEAYRDRVPRGRMPLVVLSIDVDPEMVDVNVHPAKTEVRFRDPRGVQAALTSILRGALTAGGVQRTLQPPSPNRTPRWSESRAPTLPLAPVRPVPAHPDDDPTVQLTAKPVATPPRQQDETPPSRPLAPTPAPEPLPVAPPFAADAPLRTPSVRQLVPIGPFGARWYLCEGEQTLVIVDLVRADELLTERRLQRGPIPQRLLVPARQRLPEKSVVRILEQAETLANLGLEIVQLSPTELAIRSVPSATPRLVVDGLLAKLATATTDELARVLAESQSPPESPDPRTLRATLATLEEAELDAIVARWDAATLVRGRP